MPPHPFKSAYKTQSLANEDRFTQFSQVSGVPMPSSATFSLPDEEKRFTELFQEIESIISEMNPRSDENIRKQIERHGIIPRVRHSIDMSLAEWKSIQVGGISATTVNGLSEPARGLQIRKRSVDKEASKTVALDVKVKAAPPVPRKDATPINSKYKVKTSRDTVDGASSSSSRKPTVSTSSSAPRRGHARAPSAPVNLPSSYPSHHIPSSNSHTNNSKSVDMRGSMHKPLPPLPREVWRHAQIFKYSELLKQVLAMAPHYLSERLRRAFDVIAQDIDWWHVRNELHVEDRGDGVSVASVSVYSMETAVEERHGEPSRDSLRQTRRSHEEEYGGRQQLKSVACRSKSVSGRVSVVRPEENTTLKQANAARALQRAASLNVGTQRVSRQKVAVEGGGVGYTKSERYLHPRTKD